MIGLFRLLFASFVSVVLTFSLGACTPRYDWREVHGTEVPYTVLMPVKPASHARPINLGGTEVTMTMTAADVNGALFAVGTANMPNASAAANALTAMKTALVRNIGGSVRSEKAAIANGIATLDVEAAGEGAHGRILFAHLVARDARVYQVIAIGTDKNLPREAVDTFLTSFKLN